MKLLFLNVWRNYEQPEQYIYLALNVFVKPSNWPLRGECRQHGVNGKSDTFNIAGNFPNAPLFFDFVSVAHVFKLRCSYWWVIKSNLPAFFAKIYIVVTMAHRKTRSRRYTISMLRIWGIEARRSTHSEQNCSQGVFRQGDPTKTNNIQFGRTTCENQQPDYCRPITSVVEFPIFSAESTMCSNVEPT